MVYKTASPLIGHVRVIFELPGTLWADRIYVVGNFAQGQLSRLPLQPLRDRWQAVLDLPVGRQYRFHYWVDGEWRTEGQADGFVLEAGQVPASLLDLTVGVAQTSTLHPGPGVSQEPGALYNSLYHLRSERP